MTPTLWQIEISHYNEKVRWALDYKGIAHIRKTPLPGMHRPAALLATRGRYDRLPVAEIDGKRIGDSTAIIAALEAKYPAPPLYPEDPAELARALELEDFFDEHLAPELRRYSWFHTLQDRNGIVETLIPRASARRKRVIGAVIPLSVPIVRRDYKITAEGAEASKLKVYAAMDRIEAELQPSGYLVGDTFSVADLTAAALFTPLVLPPERQYPPNYLSPALKPLRTELEARPGGQWIAEMFARHRGQSAELTRT